MIKLNMFKYILISIFVIVFNSKAYSLELLMINSKNCVYCKKFLAEVASEYKISQLPIVIIDDHNRPKWFSKAYKEKNPHLYVVAYINCSAEVKAQSDVICTSGNAINIVNKIPKDREILFVPDQNLGQWVANKTGRSMRLWPGSCYIHVLFTLRTLESIKERFPDAPIVAHPECTTMVRDMADEVCSTEKMVSFCREQAADTIIVVTEMGMLHRLQREVPEKTFVAGPTDRCACNECRYMKMNSIEKLRDSLLSLEPQIEMDEKTRKAAYKPIKRMLDWS